ncbi:MAG: hypothetical protein DMD28_11385 [Gemmatimonadetes bacterium]|nr:MAG: hypothetical protein DMD28_11385 [Gemmatimonadota bacterium]
MRVRVGITVASLAIAGGCGGVQAQASDALYARFNAVGGWELRGFTFDSGVGTKSVWQWSVPLVVVTPLGRKVSLDLTASRDRLVGSVSFNLPTGQHTLSPSEFAVAGAVGSNYLSFPVSNSGTALGVTGGLAYAQRAGTWNLGLSGSVRYLGPYSPFATDTVSYTPGVEVRVRGGADRLLGASSRLLLGLTVSTFSTDVYSGTNTLVAGSYAPGTRCIADLTLMRVIGRFTVTLAGWDLYRLAGVSSAGANPETKENLLNAELRLTYPVTPGVRLEPMVAFRQWNPSDYAGGRLRSGGVVVRASLTDRLSLAAAGRYDAGWIFDRASGRADLQGYGASVFLRFEQ